jgi:hypothetical protein
MLRLICKTIPDIKPGTPPLQPSPRAIRSDETLSSTTPICRQVYSKTLKQNSPAKLSSKTLQQNSHQQPEEQAAVVEEPPKRPGGCKNERNKGTRQKMDDGFLF